MKNGKLNEALNRLAEIIKQYEEGHEVISEDPKQDIFLTARQFMFFLKLFVKDIIKEIGDDEEKVDNTWILSYAIEMGDYDLAKKYTQKSLDESIEFGLPVDGLEELIAKSIANSFRPPEWGGLIAMLKTER